MPKRLYERHLVHLQTTVQGNSSHYTCGGIAKTGLWIIFHRVQKGFEVLCPAGLGNYQVQYAVFSASPALMSLCNSMHQYFLTLYHRSAAKRMFRYSGVGVSSARTCTAPGR
jgi:hypothetical protein